MTMSYTWKIFQEKTENLRAHEEKETFFWFQVKDFKILNIYLKNQKILGNALSSIITTSPIKLLNTRPLKV